MSGLILVSLNQSAHSTLAAIYTGILSRRKGTWISWDGTREAAPADALRQLTTRCDRGFNTLTFPLTDDEYEQGYHGYVHKGMWPVFHQRPDLAHFTAAYLLQYQSLNKAYARAVTECAGPDDDIWIQDYHLIPCIRLIREAGLNNPVGFFLHQPFPPGLGIEAIPEWQWLAESLLCCDLIGFQTQRDMNSFLLWIESTFRIERIAPTAFRVRGRTINVGVFPAGIDSRDALTLSESDGCSSIEQQCRDSLPESIILSGGHLDDSAGLPYRISAMEALLQAHPHYVGNATLLQLASPAAGHACLSRDISHHLESLCGGMNGAHGTLNWYPVSCLTTSYSREQQAGIYRAARVALVTPLVAGMSLMAKMYIALQNPDDPGVLVLSKFAGAAEQMTEAMIVNPYDPQEIAEAMHSALHLPLEERRERHGRLLRQLTLHDSHWWAEAFLSRLHETTRGESDWHSEKQLLPPVTRGKT
ncbi:alpha,alpha-trehalose-phosphate synthase (UDP-forming) [Erwinia amylovora]|uniref:alpha,alpha-trehalose-phosphate synthase (UDP-forming) n=1 Tax=Erwinia amylovora TaxID=552 RepID=UPI0014448B73|nr:trehalose-6-phosphate synthase [Erwinia amylovora]